MAFVGVLLWQYAASERNRVEEEARGLSRGFAVALDREIYGVLTTLQALATSPSLQNRDFESFYKQAKTVSDLQKINISLRDPAGFAYLTTRAPFGETVAVPPLLAQADQEVLRTGQASVSNIFTSTVARTPVFQIIEAPVIVDGKPKFLLGASIDVSYLADAIRREHLPKGWIGAIIDRNNVIVARTERHDERAGKPASSDYKIHATGDGGVYYGHNSDGRESLTGYARSALTGWTAGANLSTDELQAPLRKSLMTLAALGITLGAVAITLALITGRRLTGAFRELTVAAEAVGTGESRKPVVTRIAEINRVGEALSAAARSRVDAEAALLRLNDHLEEQVVSRTRERNRLWETTNDLIGTGSFDGRLLSVNPAWTAIVGYSEAELISKSFADLVDPTDHAKLAQAVDAVRSGESFVGYVGAILAKSGAARMIMWNAIPVLEDQIIYLVGRDMTDQLRAEDALRQAQKIEAVGQLTGGIAHDFNNMLAVIIGGLNLLQRRLARGETDVGKYVDGALEGATRAATLTQRLLAFSRQQPLAPETVDVNRLIAGMDVLLTRTLGEQHRIETVLAAGLWKAKADPNQLENVILNLAVNACDAMPEGGRLTIETANAYVDDEYAAANGMASGQYVQLSVSDTGTGMSTDIVARAFDPFFTTKAVGKGTGLGLSQVFGFARQSGGHVKIYSEVGHGTTVKLYFPRSHGDASASAKPATTGLVREGDAHEIILVVEDEDRVRNFAVIALRDLGYSVVQASNGPEALEILRAGQDVTLLFTDIVMPEMTGRQLSDAAVLIRPSLKILYTTGYSRNAIVHNGVLDAGTNLLSKPFGIDELARAVRKVIDGV